MYKKNEKNTNMFVFIYLLLFINYLNNSKLFFKKLIVINIV
jgi:hypothetical protein